MHAMVLPLIFLVMAFWLYAEFRLGPKARIAFGIGSLVGVALIVQAVCQVKPFYESAWHRNSIRTATSLIQQGQTNLVLSAFENYSQMAATGSTFRASEALMRNLRRANTD